MAETARQAINLRTLQRCDPTIHSIQDSASYVVLYKYFGGRWTKEGIEGSLFVYTRTDEPNHGLLVLNRNGINNFVRPLYQATDLDIEGQIVHISGGGDENIENIYGLWFAGGGPEAERLYGVMTRLCSEESIGNITRPSEIQTQTQTQDVPVAQAQPTMMDLLAKLSVNAGISPATSFSNPQPYSPSAVSHAPQSHSAAQSSPSADPSGALKQLLGLGASLQPSHSPQASPKTQASSVRPQTPKQKPKIRADSGYIPSPARNTAQDMNGTFNPAKAKTAILHSLSNGHVDIDATDQDDAEGKREFVRSLLNSIHTDREFVDDLYRQYVREKGGGRG